MGITRKNADDWIFPVNFPVSGVASEQKVWDLGTENVEKILGPNFSF